MGTSFTKHYIPKPQNQRAYEKLYAEYVQLHDYFGKGGNHVMKRLFQER